MKILEPDTAYTFSETFALQIPTDELAAEFGYAFSRKRLNLPQYSGELDRLDELRSRIEEVLPYVDLSSETARREILTGRVVLELIHYTKVEIHIEYPLKVTNQLQGILNYLLEAQNNVVIVAAKQADLDLGMTQLCAELIALDQWDNTPNTQSHLIGGVTTGKIWEFARLDRSKKHIEQGLESYRVPEDIEPLMRILIDALTRRPQGTSLPGH